jgi:hypothetical protein
MTETSTTTNNSGRVNFDMIVSLPKDEQEAAIARVGEQS